MIWVLNVLDAVLTHSAVSSGMFREANPVMRWVIGFGWGPLYAVKLGVVSVCVGMFYWLWDRHWFTKKAVWICVAVYILVVCWNLGLHIWAHWFL